MKQLYPLLLSLFTVVALQAQTILFDSYGTSTEFFVTDPTTDGFGMVEDYIIDRSSFSDPNALTFSPTIVGAVLRAASSDGGDIEITLVIADTELTIVAVQTVTATPDPGGSGILVTADFTGEVIPFEGYLAINVDSTSAVNDGRGASAVPFIAGSDADGLIGTSPENRFNGTLPSGATPNYAYFIAGTENQTTLPVAFARFDGERSRRGVELAWATATETGNAGFDVERSRDGVTFETIGFVGGAGTSAELTDYAYTDAAVTGGTYYYRLRQVDFDGGHTYSAVVVVDAGAAAEGPQVGDFAPNPATEAAEVNVALPDGGTVVVDLYDATGRRVAHRAIAHAAGVATERLDVSALPAGIYQATVTAEGQVFQRRLIVR